jgi:hypothetical protein
VQYLLNALHLNRRVLSVFADALADPDRLQTIKCPCLTAIDNYMVVAVRGLSMGTRTTGS